MIESTDEQAVDDDCYFDRWDYGQRWVPLDEWDIRPAWGYYEDKPAGPVEERKP